MYPTLYSHDCPLQESANANRSRTARSPDPNPNKRRLLLVGRLKRPGKYVVCRPFHSQSIRVRRRIQVPPVNRSQGEVFASQTSFSRPEKQEFLIRGVPNGARQLHS